MNHSCTFTVSVSMATQLILQFVEGSSSGHVAHPRGWVGMRSWLVGFPSGSLAGLAKRPQAMAEASGVPHLHNRVLVLYVRAYGRQGSLQHIAELLNALGALPLGPWTLTLCLGASVSACPAPWDYEPKFRNSELMIDSPLCALLFCTPSYSVSPSSLGLDMACRVI